MKPLETPQPAAERPPVQVAAANVAPAARATSRPTAAPAKPKPEARPVRTSESSARAAAASAERSRSGSPQTSASQGASGRNGEGAAMSRAGYGAILSAEIARHKVYPAAARAAGATGAIGVAFTVGAEGRIVAHTITRSSGNPELDGAVDQMMAAVQAPPPPDGVFRANIVIRFDLQ